LLSFPIVTQIIIIRNTNCIRWWPKFITHSRNCKFKFGSVCWANLVCFFSLL